MEQYKEGQYDDDLTVGIDEYDNDFDTGDIDLFDYADNEDSPLSRLKSIILSIDWEITDDILLQFNDELLDLQDIWAGNKINLIYVQALEKLSRYIYKEKASAHPNAIKLLLSFYANLEKIVSDEDMPERQKKDVLREDIEKFEKLKKQISAAVPRVSRPAEAPAPEVKRESSAGVSEIEDDEQLGKAGESEPLLNLKAIVYGIDWEITEQDLANLSREVKILEQEFKTSKAKQIFLQGIGSLGAYINLKRSDAHADAFKLLHSFFAGLERVVRENLTGQAEKDILLPEVEKFNAFKATIADTISPDAMAKSTGEEDESIYAYEDDIQPAFADVPDDTHGFQEELEAEELKQKGVEAANIDEYYDEEEDVRPQESEDDDLADEMESRLEGMFDEPSKEAALNLDAETALRGVDVESEADDESGEEPLPEEDGELSPALAGDAYPVEDDSPAVFTETIEEFFDDSEADGPETTGQHVPGVDVEHEADDDMDEDPLPYKDGEYAPAFYGDEDEEDQEDRPEQEDLENPDLENRLDEFFGESDESSGEVEAHGEESADTIFETSESDDIDDRLSDFFGDDGREISAESTEDALKGIDVETPEDDESEEEPLPFENGEIAPALREDDDDQPEGEKASADEPDLVFSEEFDDKPAEHVSGGEQEEEEVDDRFDHVFGAGQEATEIDDQEYEDGQEFEAQSDTALENEEDELQQAIRGVGVESEEDGESEEELLPLEDDEPVPALDSEDSNFGAGDGDEKDNEDAAETEIGDRFDSFFEQSEPEEEEDSASEEPEEEAAPQDFSMVDDDFEEISGEEIEEISAEDMLADQEQRDDEEILAFLSEADDSLLDFEEFPEDEIEELSAEEIGAVLVEDGVIRTDGQSQEYTSASEFESTEEDAEDFISHPEGNEDYIIGVEGLLDSTEEEVVFEAVEEAAEISDEHIPENEEQDLGYDGSQYFETTLLSDEPVIRKTAAPAELGVHALKIDESLQPPIKDDGSAYVEPKGAGPSEDMFSDLRSCIISLGLEIDDEILNSLNEEIEKLRHAYLHKPAEKTFIQLLATVSGHIEKYRYEADAEANRLLLSIFDKLELTALGKTDSSEIQEAVLNETSRVLHWQARLIDRMPPPAEDDDEEEKQGLGDAAIAGLDEMYRQVDEIGNDMLMQKVSAIMKNELDQLKSAFQMELKELKEEIRRRKA